MPLDADLLNPCSFCGQGQNQVNALIAGPGVFICDVCIDRVHEVLTVTGRTASTPIALIQKVHDEVGIKWCKFCGLRSHQVSAMAAAGDTRICDECLRQCREIRRERLGYSANDDE